MGRLNLARWGPTLKAPGWSLGIAALLWAVIGHGFANYDALYSLVWGQQLSRGETPQYALPIAPTPHPLGTFIGLVLSPLGPAGAEAVLVALGMLSLGALGYVVYRLGTTWFGWPAGLVAAMVILTREPILSYGIRAYVDVPYLVLVLTAVLIETRRALAGAPVLVLLAFAGLLRPEAWLFSALYLAWLVLGERTGTGVGREPSELARLAVLAVSAPLLWALVDGLITGNPLWSLTNTRQTAATLGRVTGLTNVPTALPRRLGEVLREPGLFGAAVGGGLSLAWLRRRATMGAMVGALAVLAFAILATAGLSIITRYVFLTSSILAIFCGAGAFGWRLLEPGDRRRHWWQAGGAVVVAGLLAFIPAQADRLRHTFDALGIQQQVQGDLVELVKSHAIGTRCGPVSVPNHRPVPLLALRLEIPPDRIIDAQVVGPIAGTFAEPANSLVAHAYILDPHDPHPLSASVPLGFRLTAQNRSWGVFERCG